MLLLLAYVLNESKPIYQLTLRKRIKTNILFESIWCERAIFLALRLVQFNGNCCKKMAVPHYYIVLPLANSFICTQ